MRRPDAARILSLATAVPPHVLRQPEVLELVSGLFGGRSAEVERLLPVFGNAGIDTRYSCVPVDWYLQPHGWPERNRLYLQNAEALLERVSRECLERAGLDTDDIDMLVVVSTTGIATPSLDALLMERLGLRRDVRRLPIFGLGCGGGVGGLARAAMMAEAMPGARVLFLVVELCALSFRRDDLSKSNIVATALFGDGAAGVLLSTEGDGPAVGASGEHTWPDSLGIMGWDVEEEGLKAIFSRDIPALVRADLRPVADRFLAGSGLSVNDVRHFACHPGGAKVLDALESAYDLSRGALAEARQVLREYGNMSAATVLFVLDRLMGAGLSGLTLMTALGPGFTASFLTLDAA